MTLATILRYQFGSRIAIRVVATDSSAFMIGIALVLMTAIARNYDQSYFFQSGRWLFGPLIFSFFSGTFLYYVLRRLFLKRHEDASAPAGNENQWWSFMGLFWITAPVAWLYAIPVERMFDSYRATQANIALLATVSLWRVLLMSRVISVLQEVRFARALGWVTLPACIEVVLVAFFGLFFGSTFGRSVLATMGGMRHAPEEDLLLSAVATAGNVAFWSMFVVATLLAVLRFHGVTRLFPKQSACRVRWVGLLALAIFWIAVAIQPQKEQRRFARHAAMIEAGKYRAAVDYLAREGRDAFPPGRRLEPNPYEYRAYEELPGTIAALQASDPKWIREMYLDYAARLFEHYVLRLKSTNAAVMFIGMARLPEGRDWAEGNRTNLHKVQIEAPAGEAKSLTNENSLAVALEKLGIEAKDFERSDGR